MPAHRKKTRCNYVYGHCWITALSAKDETKALNFLDTQKEILTPIILKNLMEL